MITLEIAGGEKPVSLFGTLEDGQCFYLENSTGDIYRKFKDLNTENGYYRNAVSMTKTQSFWVELHTRCIPVTVKLLVG